MGNWVDAIDQLDPIKFVWSTLFNWIESPNLIWQTDNLFYLYVLVIELPN